MRSLSATLCVTMLLSFSTLAQETPAAGAKKPAAAKKAADAKKSAAKKAVRMTPGGKWPVRSMDRPRPRVVDPGDAGAPAGAAKPPSDAVVLFDGKDLSKFQTTRKGGVVAEPGWKIENGYAEIAPKGGAITSKDSFGDAQIHIEWATPSEVKGSSQGRGNSGVFLQGICEVQVLDSYENDTYPDGQAASIYGKYPPLVNACRKPGEWQSYDIIFNAAKRDDSGKVTQPMKLTVLHNGVVVHHAIDLQSSATQFRLNLQDHGNPVRYRNIWVRPLKDYDEQ